MASFGASDTSETDTDTDALGIGRARGPAPAPALSPVPASPSFGMGDTTTDAESSGAEGLGINGDYRPCTAPDIIHTNIIRQSPPGDQMRMSHRYWLSTKYEAPRILD